MFTHHEVGIRLAVKGFSGSGSLLVEAGIGLGSQLIHRIQAGLQQQKIFLNIKNVVDLVPVESDQMDIQSILLQVYVFPWKNKEDRGGANI
jgi:hypothetical protein